MPRPCLHELFIVICEGDIILTRVCVCVCVCVFQVEDLADEVFAQRHLALEQREKLRWGSWGKRKCCRHPKRWKHTNTRIHTHTKNKDTHRLTNAAVSFKQF